MRVAGRLKRREEQLSLTGRNCSLWAARCSMRVHRTSASDADGWDTFWIGGMHALSPQCSRGE